MTSGYANELSISPLLRRVVWSEEDTGRTTCPIAMVAATATMLRVNDVSVSYGAVGKVYRYGYNRGTGVCTWHGRERQHVVQHGHDSSVISKRFRRLFTGRPPFIELLSSSTGAIWVAGHCFSIHLASQPKLQKCAKGILKLKYQLAGNEYKSLTQAQAVWKSIPAQVRAGGPEALLKFHQGKEWSHIIPRSQGRIIDRGQRDLVGILKGRIAPWDPIQ